MTRARGQWTPVAALVSLALLVSGCADRPADNSSGAGGALSSSGSAAAVTERTVAPVVGSELPIDARPALLGQGDTSQCPYLDGQWVQNTNGQRLTGTGVDTRFDPPACVFWSYEDSPQVQVLVRKMTTNSQAVAVVDQAAPIDSTLKALSPAGWSGGRRGGDEHSGAVYAVWKDETAVVVLTDQDQSVKAQQIAEEAIKNLQL